MSEISAEIKVLGSVQGVFFRKMSTEKAQSLNLTGYACNNHDGSVTLYCEGLDSEIEDMCDWLKTNPGSSKIKDIHVRRGSPSGAYSEFTIRYI